MLCVLAKEVPHLIREAQTCGSKLSSHGIKGADAVVLVGVRFRIGASLPLFCEYMNKDGFPELFPQADGIFKLLQIMPVNGTEIIQPHIAEDIARQYAGFEPLFCIVRDIVHPPRA